MTCTLGEEGEVLVPALEHLAADQDDALGEHRITELANAMKELGVTDHRFLGGAGHYRDSGMMWDEQRRAVARPRPGRARSGAPTCSRPRTCSSRSSARSGRRCW